MAEGGGQRTRSEDRGQGRRTEDKVGGQKAENRARGWVDKKLKSWEDERISGGGWMAQGDRCC